MSRPARQPPAADPARDFAFGETLVAAYRIVRRTAWRLTHHHDRAEDLVQATMLKAWLNRDRVGDAPFAAWIRTVCLNVFRQSLRARQPVFMAEPPEGVDPITPERIVGASTELARALAQLPEKFSVPLVGRAAGWTDEELAERLHIHPATVRTRALRARRALASAEVS